MAAPDASPDAAPAAPVFDADAARAAGATDQQIANFLAPKRGFDLEGARNAGASYGEIVNFLAPPPVEPPPAAPVRGTLAAMGARAARAPTEFASSMIGGAGAITSGVGSLLNAGARGSDEFARSQIDIMNRIDAGGHVNPMDDPLGYADATPDLRATMRADYEKALGEMPGPEQSPLGVAGGALQAAGGAVRGAGEAVKAYGEAAHPLTEEEQQRWLVRGTGAITGLLPYLGAAALGGVPAIIGVAGVEGFGQGYDAAKAKGASDDDAAVRGTLEGLVSAGMMVVPLHKALDVAAALPGMAKGEFIKGLVEMAKSGATLSTFAELQNIADNAVAKVTQEPERPLTAGFGQNAGVNFVAGAIIPGFAAAMHAGASRVGAALRPRPTVPDVLNAGSVDDAINAANAVASSSTPIDAADHAATLDAGDGTDQQQAKLLRMFQSIPGTGAFSQAADGTYQVEAADPRNGQQTTIPVKVWDPDGPTDEHATGPIIAPDEAQAIRDHYAAAGVDTVFYQDHPAMPFDGAVDPDQPDTIFVSNNPARAVAQVAGHEFSHVLATTTLPDGTSLGDLLNRQIAAGITPAGQAHAEATFGVTAPKREALPPGPLFDRAHEAMVQAHLVNELGADIGAEAPRFQSFLPRVVDAIQARFGDTVAGDVLRKLIAGLRTAVDTIRDLFHPTPGAGRDLFGDVGTQSQNWVTNLGDIHDTLAQMYAERFGSPVERQYAAEAGAREQAARDRFVTDLVQRANLGGQRPAADPQARLLEQTEAALLRPVGGDEAALAPEQADRLAQVRARREALEQLYTQQFGSPGTLTLRRWLASLAAERDAATAASPQAKLLQQTEAAILRPVGGDETALAPEAQARLGQVRAGLVGLLRARGDTPAMAAVRSEIEATKGAPAAPAAVESKTVLPARKPAAVPREPQPPTPYVAVPPEPQRLIGFLRQKIVTQRDTIHEQTLPGGLRDTTGDVAAIIGGARGRPGLINNKDGQYLDDATLRAWENGYFHEESERPDIHALLRKIDEDHRGNPQYSSHDFNAVHAYRYALARNSEIDRLASEHGIPTHGITSTEFFDRLRAAMSQEQRAQEDAAEGAAVEDEWDVFTHADEDEAPGSLADDERDIPPFEELEDEYRQEADAGAPLDSEAGDARPGPIAEGEGAGEEGVRPDDGDPGDAGRGTAGAGEAGSPGGVAPKPPAPSRALDADGQVAEAIAAKLEGQEHTAPGVLALSARELQELADHYYGGTLASGAYTRDRLYDAIETGVNRYIQKHPVEYSTNVDADVAKLTADRLAELKRRLPTQTVRAGEKDAYQQFSTPPDYSYAVAWVAHMHPGDSVLEPSAGTGSLAVHAMNAGAREVTANELSAKRRGMLAVLDPTRITAEDAAQLHNILPADIKPTVVLMNPPFSRSAERMGNRKVLDEGFRHVEQALARLQPGGRLVAIVGDTLGPRGPRGPGLPETSRAFSDWWTRISGQYDARADVRVGREIYAKMGTNFPTRLLVIDKQPPSGRATVTGAVETSAELIDRLKDVRDDRSTVESVAGQSNGPAMAPGGAGVGGPGHELSGATGVVGSGERGDGAAAVEPEPAGTGQPGVGGGRTPRPRPQAGGGGNQVVPGEPERGPLGTGAEPRPAAPAGAEPNGGRAGDVGDGIRPDGSGERVDPGVTAAPQAVIATEAAVSDPAAREITEAVYEPYHPQRITVEGAQPHPGALVQSAAMAAALPPATSYQPRLPRALITSGALSDAQLEAVVYAGHAHSDMLPGNGGRRGLFIGDGTGVGKGREIAGIILDNFSNGRTKAVWISEKRDLITAAKNDWSGIGQSVDLMIDHGKMKPGDPIAAKKGILFTSYDTLKSAEQTKAAGTKVRGKERVDQIVDWLGKDFDGVIAFDESHALGNSVAEQGERGVKAASQKALAGVALQDKLPNARVVYVSATGATEVGNLAYAKRLGLWGEGTAFASRADFIGRIASGGMAAMELVARDMKALGSYIARNLSYDGVEYNRLEHVLTGEQRGVYDKLAEGWQVVLQHFEAALKGTSGNVVDGRRKGAILAQFWGGHQRFFNQIITAMQMPTVIRSVERDVAEGRHAVLQLVNTMEAAQERALEKARASGEGELDDLDMTPRDQLMQMVESAYPIQQYEDYVEPGSTVVKSRPVVDSQGNPVINPEMVARRDRLLNELGSLRVPDGPLEILTNHFGTDKIAEVTGRKQRVVRKLDENGQMKTVVEKRAGSANIAETNAFQDGKKPILVFSEAGGTGRSYHAAIGSGAEGARRSHYLVQAGWRADKAVQGFGRTHRTNQASAPIFHLVTTDLQGQKRFISSIARRLGQLGALTKGERRAADQGLFTMRDNLESTEARAALRQFFQDVHRGDVPGITTQDLERGMGLKLTDPTTGGLRADLPEMSTFLNRVLSLTIERQNHTFQAFSDRMDAVIDRAASAGTLDTGVETYRADKITKASEQTVYTEPRSGAETKHVQLEVYNRNSPIDFDATLAGRNRTGGERPTEFVRSERSGNVFAVTRANAYTDNAGNIIDQARLTSPTDYQYLDRHKLAAGENWTRLTPEAARPLWDAQVANTPEFQKSDLHLITGAILPIWDRLPGNPKIYRLQTEAGERMLGRVVPNSIVADTLKRLGAGMAARTISPAELVGRIMGGDTAHLANGWRIKPSLVAGERRMELIGPDYRYNDELARHGVFTERIGSTTRYFIPTGSEAAEALRGITASRPLVRVGDNDVGLSGPDAGARSAGRGVGFSPRRLPIPPQAGTDLLGRAAPEEKPRAEREATARNDRRQVDMFGRSDAAVQAQAARDQAGRGGINPKGEVKPADEGLFKPREKGGGTLFSPRQASDRELQARANRMREWSQDGARSLAWIEQNGSHWQVVTPDFSQRSYAQQMAQRMLVRTFGDKQQAYAWAQKYDAGLRAQITEPRGGTLFSPPITGADRETEAYTPEQIAAYSRVGRVTDEPGWRARLATATDDLGRRALRYTLDPYIGVKRDDPAGYMALRNANTTAGASLMFLTDGTLKFNGSTYAMADRNGGVEHALIRPLQGEQDRFLWWVAAHRAGRLAQEDRENLWSPEDIAAIKGTNRGQTGFDYKLPNGAVTRSREAIYADSLRKLDVFNRNVMDLAVESGLLDRGKISAMLANPFYVPFYRQAEDTGQFAGPRISPQFVKQYAFKQLKGGAEKLNHDLWQNAIGNWSHMIDASLRNRAAADVLDTASTNGGAHEVTPQEYEHQMTERERKAATWVMKDGERQYYAIDDKMLYTAITALNFNGFNNPIMKAVGKFKQWLTIGVTSNPLFMLRVSIRDAEQAVATAPMSYNVLGNIAKGFRMGDLPGALQNVARAVAGQETHRHQLSDRAADVTAGGGTMHLGSGVDTGIRKTDLATMLDTPNAIAAFWKRIGTIGKAYHELTAMGEDVHRFALYDKLIAEGVPHDAASFAARDLEDFTLRGAGTIVRGLTQMVPFMNAWAQGLYKVGRAAVDSDRNITTAVGGRLAASATRRVITVLGATTLLTLALDALYQDDEDYKKRTEDDRNSNFWFKFGGVQFRIPMGFEIAALSRIASNGVEAFFDKEMTARRFFNNVGSIFASNLSMNPTPQIIRPALDLAMNQSSTGAPIVPEGMKTLRSEYQYNANTTLLARGIGAVGAEAARAVGGPQARFLSPLQLDYLTKGYFGWLGSMITGTADRAARQFAPVPARPAMDVLSFVTGGMVTTQPDSQSRYVDLLYQQAAGINAAFDTYRKLLLTGRAGEAREFFAENKGLIARHSLVAELERFEATQEQIARRIENNPNFSPEQKRIKLMAVNAARNRMAERAFGGAHTP